MEKWIVTGVSGSGRIELLEELRDYAKTIGKTVMVHDVGDLIYQECQKQRIDYSDQRILNLDPNLLKMLRVAVFKDIKNQFIAQPDVDAHMIGVHATFRWKNRLIQGFSYSDLMEIQPDSFLNVVDDVKNIYSNNRTNPKWTKILTPSFSATMHWMQEEEFITELLADIQNKPMFLIARHHHTHNLADLLFTAKKKIYLSYPITAVKNEDPQLLEQIQGPILKELEKNFIVFNPLDIEDMSLTNTKIANDLPQLTEQLTTEAEEIIKTRTVERDYQLIDQSDAVVVFYLTNKVSPGVLSEINYAHRTQTPVFMVYYGERSPFIEAITTRMENDIESLMKRLTDFANQQIY